MSTNDADQAEMERIERESIMHHNLQAALAYLSYLGSMIALGVVLVHDYGWTKGIAVTSSVALMVVAVICVFDALPYFLSVPTVAEKPVAKVVPMQGGRPSIPSGPYRAVDTDQKPPSNK